MIIKEEINDFDWIQVPSDFAPGDEVMVQTPEYRGFGRIIELSEERLCIQTVARILDYGVNSPIPFPEIFHYLIKLPDFSAIELGTVLSRPNKTYDGKWYRQYGKVTDIVLNEYNELNGLSLLVMNGPEEDAELEISSNPRRSFDEKMVDWQIEE